MEELVLEKSKVKLKLYGKEYFLTKPTLDQVERYDELSKQDETKHLENAKKLLEMLGLPLDAMVDLEMGHLVQIIEFLFGAKKK